MTTLSDWPNTALVVIDVQNGVVANAHQRDDVIGNISTLVDKARAEDVPAIWVQHTSDELPQGSDQWQYVEELQQSAPSPSSTSGTATRSRTRTSSRSSRRTSAASSSRARRPTSASGRPCTGVRARLRRILVGDAHTTEDLGVGCTDARQGDLAHQHVLEVPHGARSDGGVVETSDVRFDSSDDEAADEDAPEGEVSS